MPILTELSAANGDPDRIGAPMADNWSVATLQAPEVAPGFFFGLREALGPFPRGGG